MLSLRTTAVAVATLLVTQACAKDSQTEKSVETTTSDGQISASMSGDSADKRGVALVRVVNAVPDSKELQIRADDQRMLPMVGFQKVSGYTPIDATWATFQIGGASSAAFLPLNTNREMLTDGHRYTIVVLRSEDGSTYDTRVMKDAIETEAGKARLRVVHAAPGAGEVQIRAKGGETLFEGLDYGDDDGFKSLDPWSGMLEVRSNDGKTLLLSTPKLMLDAGKSYTVVVSRTTAGKLEAFWFEDAQIN